LSRRGQLRGARHSHPEDAQQHHDHQALHVVRN